jgi:hypothetical protein
MPRASPRCGRKMCTELTTGRLKFKGAKFCEKDFLIGIKNPFLLD